LEVVTEGELHWASVRFSGSIREEASAPTEAFEEIWHMRKPLNVPQAGCSPGYNSPADPARHGPDPIPA